MGKLQVTEAELERAEERCEVGETKIMELEEELKVVATNLKSLEVSEEKANQREIANKEQVKTLTAKLKQAEARAEFAEICRETAEGGGQAGGRADGGAGEVQGDHRGAGADIRRDVWILDREEDKKTRTSTVIQKYEAPPSSLAAHETRGA